MEPRRVLMVGAGGHARVCLEALIDDPTVVVVGAVSRDGTGISGLGIALLGRDTELGELASRLSVTHAFVAIGDNAARLRWPERLRQMGLGAVNAVSRRAIISPTAAVGSGVAVMPGAVVNAGTTIGDAVILNTNSSVDHDCVIEAGVHIAPGVAIAGAVHIGAGAFVGIGSCVIPGITIGAGAVLGAGSVVIRDVPEGATVAGNPARAIGRA